MCLVLIQAKVAKKAKRSCWVKYCLDTGVPSMNENKGWEAESRFLMLRYRIRAWWTKVGINFILVKQFCGNGRISNV